jgi:hypothetical protein
MKMGDKLYRVVDDGDELEIQVRAVKSATAKTFSLDRPFSFCAASHGVLRCDKVLGKVMFLTELEVINDAERRAKISVSQARSPLQTAERQVAGTSEARQKMKP